MAELNENQLLLLDNLIYLDRVSNMQGFTVKQVINDLLEKGGLEASRNLEKIGTEDEWPVKMSHDDWVKVLTNIKNDPDLMELTISNGKENDKGMRAACFVDDDGDATAVFRGTSGDFEWHDNGQGGYLSDTDSQTKALEYINGLPYNNITVTGHSKGGNKAQYVALLSDKVDKCVSFDGQGFSKEFFETHGKEFTENRHKIISISAESDFVNCLLFPAAEKDNIKYVDTEHQDNYLYNHCPNIMLDSNGNLRDDTVEQDPKSQLINRYTEYVDTHYPKPERSYIIDGLIGGFLEEGSQKEGPIQKWTSAILLLPGLPGFTEETAIRMIDDKVREILKETGRFVEDKIEDAVESAEKILEKTGDTIKQKLEDAGNTAADILTGAGSAIKDTIDGAGRAANKAIDAVSSGIAALFNGNEAYDKDRIEVNITKLYETAEVYKSCKTELEGMLQELNTCMENLKAHWEGEARESYFANAFPKFNESMKKHIAKIAFLEKELAGAAGQFQNLDAELRSKLA